MKVLVGGSWGKLSSHYPVCTWIRLAFLYKDFGKFYYFQIFFYAAATTKNIFLCKVWWEIGAPFSGTKFLQ